MIPAHMADIIMIYPLTESQISTLGESQIKLDSSMENKDMTR